jgi:hypothetical protein
MGTCALFFSFFFFPVGLVLLSPCDQRFDDLAASLPPGLLPDVNVLLIDAQGMEHEILSGMAGTLRGDEPSTKDHIRIEVKQRTPPAPSNNTRPFDRQRVAMDLLT